MLSNYGNVVSTILSLLIFWKLFWQSLRSDMSRIGSTTKLTFREAPDQVSILLYELGESSADKRKCCDINPGSLRRRSSSYDSFILTSHGNAHKRLRAESSPSSSRFTHGSGGSREAHLPLARSRSVYHPHFHQPYALCS